MFQENLSFLQRLHTLIKPVIQGNIMLESCNYDMERNISLVTVSISLRNPGLRTINIPRMTSILYRILPGRVSARETTGKWMQEHNYPSVFSANFICNTSPPSDTLAIYKLAAAPVIQLEPGESLTFELDYLIQVEEISKIRVLVELLIPGSEDLWWKYSSDYWVEPASGKSDFAFNPLAEKPPAQGRARKPRQIKIKLDPESALTADRSKEIQTLENRIRSGFENNAQS